MRAIVFSKITLLIYDTSGVNFLKGDCMTKINGTSFQRNATLKGNITLKGNAKDKETKPDTIFVNVIQYETITEIVSKKYYNNQGKEMKTLPDFIENSRTPNSILRSVKPENK